MFRSKLFARRHAAKSCLQVAEKRRLNRRRLVVENLEERAVLATFAWAATASNANWTTPSSWQVSGGTDTDGIPDSDDVVVFNSSSSQPSFLNANLTVGQITIASNYSGQLQLGSNQLTVLNGFSTALASQVVGANGTVRLQGTQTVNSVSPIPNLVIDTMGTISLARDVVIDGRLTLNSVGSLTSTSTALRTLDVKGDYVNNSPAYASVNAKIRLSGSGIQNYSGNGTTTNLEVGPFGGAVRLSNDLRIGNGGTLQGNANSTIIGTTGSESLVIVGSNSPAAYTLEYLGTVQNVIINMTGPNS